ncbi:MAG TPA: hemerythrin domain-containing protein [Bacteriovoracaceae bacterium]|nr:hemerythrin domain-containing protein [Bacteriovoracaceae bacterium]
METILHKLKQEHQEVDALMSEIESCKDTRRKMKLYQQMKDSLLPHMEGEEKTLYARLRNEVHQELAEDIAQDADSEHQEVKDIIARLDEQDPKSPEWDRMFHSLKEHVRFHVAEEESELFEEAKEDFTREELIQIANEFEEVKSHIH